MKYSAFITYLAVIFITPGPSNITSLYLGAKYGIRGAQRFIAESATGFSIKYLLCAVLNLWLASAIPAAMPYLKWIGAAYMAYFAYTLLRSGFSGDEDKGGDKRSDYPSGLLLQLVNIKSYITCLSIPAVFVIPYTDRISDHLIAAALTVGFMLAATYIWCVSGKVLERVYTRYKKLFSVVLALSMVYCIITTIK